MKKKQNRFLQICLLLGVVGIWGFAGYRFVKNGSEDPDVEIAQPKSKKKPVKAVVSSYALMANYRDPFLNELPDAEEEAILEETAAEPVLPPPPVAWPPLEFHGVMKNKKGKKELALVTLNGHQHLMKPGQLLEGIRIDRLFADSCRFSYSGEKKTFLAR